MQESATATTKNTELLKIDSRDVLTDDGRRVGVLKGILVDTAAWTVPQLVVEVDKNALDELKLKKPMLSTVWNISDPRVKNFLDELKLKKPGTMLVNVPTTHVRSISDVVQLNTDLASVSSVVTIAEKK